MNELSIKAFDFGIRIIELANYLDEEKKLFPLMARLLECGTGIGVYLRISNNFSKSLKENCMQAYKLALETEYLLELMVKTGFINENQSKPILTDCRLIKDETGKQLSKKG